MRPEGRLRRTADRRFSRLVLSLAIGAVLAGCSHNSAALSLIRVVQEMLSWSASTRLAIERWQSRVLPTAYVTDALEAAQEEIRQQIEQVSQQQDAPANDREQARRLGRVLLEGCTELERLVQQGNGGGAAKVGARMAAAERTLRAQIDRERATAR